ncbi:hypothetical protein DL766_008860 [Monosporascus sp. MC13-8B]|nr:hypothetical protein DL763_002083 [Monosporascus cannonballus]RYP17659.1 hypothetical protein DL766_008860 [Monosporascus sp. MC13-8B]
MATRTEQDRRLLAGGLFSDVVVKCGTRSWHLHRSILCSRSGHFRAALAGPFQEAETREIDLSEHDEETIDRPLTWIYTKQLPPIVSFSGGTCYETAVKLFVAADFCLVRELREDCLEALENSIWEQVLRTQRQFDAAPDKTAFLRTGGDLDNLFRGVRAAYEADFGVLKDVFVDFMRDTHFWPATSCYGSPSSAATASIGRSRSPTRVSCAASRHSDGRPPIGPGSAASRAGS